MAELYKSPMNYLGNKYKLLPQMLSIFPKNIKTFYDIFAGGLDVSLNIDAEKIIVNDKHTDLINLYMDIKEFNESLGDKLYEMDKKYFPMNEYNGKSLGTYQRNGQKYISDQLLEMKKKVYYKLREDYNSGNIVDFKILLLLMFNSVSLVEFRVINNYITFTSGQGKVNKRILHRLNEFPERLNHFHFMNQDFRFFLNCNFDKNDFIYLDPPYLGTSQYKMKWNSQDESDLYNMLDYLDSKGVNFALSNFADGKNHTNEYLKKWCGKYNIYNINDKHSILTGRIKKSNERQEILITNFQ